MGVNEYEWNRPASMTLPGGMTKEFDYDPLMRVKQITSTDPAKEPDENKVMEYQYDYGNMDNIVSKSTDHGNYGYGYDDLYRLTAADNPEATGISDEAFSYDGVGNRLTSADTTGSWAYNENNELESTPPSSSGSTGGSSFEYDANGNMVKKTTGETVTSYVYNLEDRLSQVWSGEAGTGTLIAEYYYDPFGRRLWKRIPSPEGEGQGEGIKTYYHYSDEGLIGEYDGSGIEIKTYGYKPDSLWTTDPLFMKIGSQYYFYHNDHLGMPQKMTDISGAVVWSAKYESFGKAVVEVAAIENNLRFPGQYYDSETGLHYNWFRYYDPGVGRYLRVDPIGFLGGDTDLYVYTLDNPINRWDSRGLFLWYGNWGGPNWTGGKATSWEKMSEEERKDALKNHGPIDSLDKCYMHHDICYGEGRESCRDSLCDNPDPNDCYKKKFNECDKKLLKCLKKLGDWPGNWDNPPKTLLDKLGVNLGQRCPKFNLKKLRKFALKTPESLSKKRLCISGYVTNG